MAAPKADGSGLAVTVTEQMSQTGRAVLESDTSVPLTITVGPGPQPGVGRQADTASFFGGSRYQVSTINCSNGIPIRFGDVYRMLTAGHCGNDGRRSAARPPEGGHQHAGGILIVTYVDLRPVPRRSPGLFAKRGFELRSDVSTLDAGKPWFEAQHRNEHASALYRVAVIEITARIQS